MFKLQQNQERNNNYFHYLLLFIILKSYNADKRMHFFVIVGTRDNHAGETNPKAILVMAGGSLDIHGLPKRSWTKLAATVPVDGHSPDIIFNHMVSLE